MGVLWLRGSTPVKVVRLSYQGKLLTFLVYNVKGVHHVETNFYTNVCLKLPWHQDQTLVRNCFPWKDEKETNPLSSPCEGEDIFKTRFHWEHPLQGSHARKRSQFCQCLAPTHLWHLPRAGLFSHHQPAGPGGAGYCPSSQLYLYAQHSGMQWNFFPQIF